MRSEIYKAISAALFKIGADGKMMSDTEVSSGSATLIKYVDLWNHNVEFIEQETGWPMPAVFIEFGRITWEALIAGRQYRTHSQVILHIVTSWSSSASSASGLRDTALEVLDYSEMIQKALTGLDGSHFCHLKLRETQTNHNHEEIMENIDVYDYTGEVNL